MGGGMSNLFYGTKGAQEEYQYTLFQDKKTLQDTKQAVVASVGTVSERSKRLSHKRKITVTIVIVKCNEFYSGLLDIQGLVNWLICILEPDYEMEAQLRQLIETTLNKFDLYLKHIQLPIEELTAQVHSFERELCQLL